MRDHSIDSHTIELEAELWRRIVQMADDLDDERFDDFLSACLPEIRYRITTYSPDLGKDMTFMDLEGDELEILLSTVDQHVRPLDKLLRHPGRPVVRSIDDALVVCNTKLAVHYVDASGVPGIYALGRYHDRFQLSEGGPMLASRDVVLSSRQFPFGSHVPL